MITRRTHAPRAGPRSSSRCRLCLYGNWVGRGLENSDLAFLVVGRRDGDPPVPASPQPRKPSSHEPVPRASRNFFLLSCLFLSYFDSIHMVEELPTYPPCFKALAELSLPTYLPHRLIYQGSGLPYYERKRKSNAGPARVWRGDTQADDSGKASGQVDTARRRALSSRTLPSGD